MTWKCCGCGAEVPELIKRCDCVTMCAFDEKLAAATMRWPEEAKWPKAKETAYDIADALEKVREFVRIFSPREDHLGDRAKDIAILIDDVLERTKGAYGTIKV